MSSEVATAIALLIYAAAFVPIAWMAFRSRSVRWLAPLTGLLVLAIALVQTGILHRGSLASTDVTGLLQTDSSDARCEQVFEVLTANGVVLEPPGRGRLVVRGADWDRMPAVVQDAVTACVDMSGVSDDEGDGPEVIRR
jgi:hypothetical protein